MKDRTKEVLKDGFGSLISNAAAIRGAKAGPLWLTILFFVFSLILPIIPLFVAQVKTNGSSFLTNYSYGLERYVTKMAMDLKDQGVEFGIDEEHMLSVNENGTEVDFNEYGSAKPYAGYVDAVSNQYNFVLYLSNATSTSEKNAVNKVITTTYYQTGTTIVVASDDSYYLPSYMILFKNGVYVTINQNNGVKPVAYSYSGDFKTIKANDKCLATLLSVKDKDGAEVAPSIINNEYVDGVYKNYKKFSTCLWLAGFRVIKPSKGVSGGFVG